MSLIFLYAGHFLLSGRWIKVQEPDESSVPAKQAETTAEPAPKVDPVKYSRRSEVINGLKQEINILEVDPGSSAVKILPVLSHDLIYGFERLSKMAARKNAYAAINGGFFHEFGLPSGMVVIDGELLSASTGKYPVFIVTEGKAELKEINSTLSIEFGTDSKASIPVDTLNFPAKGLQTVVYTPAFGNFNRATKKNITVTVKNSIVSKVADYPGEVEIPEDGILITFYNTKKYAGIELPIKVGDTIKLTHHPEVGADMQAYECGTWLVKDGVSVVQEKDAWVGILTNRDPRTAVGIREDGSILLLTVDGRQPGYSAGFTGKELAEYLISCGATTAAMLDGGASTEMLLEGKLVNKPSYKGEERQVAGGIAVLLEK